MNITTNQSVFIENIFKIEYKLNDIFSSKEYDNFLDSNKTKDTLQDYIKFLIAKIVFNDFNGTEVIPNNSNIQSLWSYHACNHPIQYQDMCKKICPDGQFIYYSDHNEHPYSPISQTPNVFCKKSSFSNLNAPEFFEKIKAFSTSSSSSAPEYKKPSIDQMIIKNKFEQDWKNNEPIYPRYWPHGISPTEGKITGEVKWYDTDKGYGFISPEFPHSIMLAGDDIFVHQSSIHAPGFRSLRKGEWVEFRTVEERGKVKAIDVSGPQGMYVQGALKPKSKPKPKTPKQNNSCWIQKIKRCQI